MKSVVIKPEKIVTEKKPSSILDRIVADRDEATNELAKIDKFISSKLFSLLNDKKQTLTLRQKDIMHDLVSVLNARIAIEKD